jgi:hypothetical protein
MLTPSHISLFPPFLLQLTQVIKTYKTKYTCLKTVITFLSLSQNTPLSQKIDGSKTQITNLQLSLSVSLSLCLSPQPTHPPIVAPLSPLASIACWKHLLPHSSSDAAQAPNTCSLSLWSIQSHRHIHKRDKYTIKIYKRRTQWVKNIWVKNIS